MAGATEQNPGRTRGPKVGTGQNSPFSFPTRPLRSLRRGAHSKRSRLPRGGGNQGLGQHLGTWQPSPRSCPCTGTGPVSEHPLPLVLTILDTPVFSLLTPIDSSRI